MAASRPIICRRWRKSDWRNSAIKGYSGRTISANVNPAPRPYRGACDTIEERCRPIRPATGCPAAPVTDGQVPVEARLIVKPLRQPVKYRYAVRIRTSTSAVNSTSFQSQLDREVDRCSSVSVPKVSPLICSYAGGCVR